ncbi:MAG: hypothetical protein Tp138OMZ00d2C19078241_52 [Prokaryotic dsDNA virus sp.]|jgi:hypothetical protein|nr:MAG: hypothetical protein Tp138OMZ00d2C19078241_52 [Prokaryotic dsDNA virus sp.]|tara:strand:- start:5784 stop:6080 length:297 start_codon:yes stop_codon:yes gene_type:complete
MKNLEIAENSSTLYNLGDDGCNDIWFNVNKYRADREAEIQTALEIMKRVNMHDQLVEALSDMIEQFADFDEDAGELKQVQRFAVVNTAMELIEKEEGQ